MRRRIEGAPMASSAGKGARIIAAPICEGAIGPAKRQYRKWRQISDEEVEVLAKAAMDGQVSDLGCLRKLDSGLAKEVERRGLCGKLGLSVRKFRSWMRMSDDEVLIIVNEFVGRNGLSGMRALWDADSGMADRVRDRGLEGRVKFCNRAAYSAMPAGKVREKRPETENQVPYATPVPDHPQPESESRAEAHPQAPPALEDREIASLAQDAIGEFGLSSPADLKAAFPELYDEMESRKLWSSVGFTKETAEEEGRLGGFGLADSAEAVRKAGAERAHADERSMFMLICAECFRVGTANPYIGGFRSTLQKLHSGISRRLGGPAHKAFRKCWDRMAAEGAITFNSNSTAASLNMDACVRDKNLREALEWAKAEQASVARSCSRA